MYFALIILSFLIFTLAETTVTSTGSQQAVTSLPRCIDDPAAIDRIKNIISANRKSSHKYDGYSLELQSESDREIFTRLAYAETLAANCSNLNSSVSQKIVSVIGNRVQARGGNVRSVLFQRDQFASSLNIYSSSKYMDFLCPKDVALWTQISRQVEKILSSQVTDLAPDSINYFLYKHDSRWTKDPWSFKENTSNTTDELRSCIKVFHVPQWK